MTGKDWICLVTGSTQGIGFEIAKTFLGVGSRVAVNGRTREHTEQAVRQLRAAGTDLLAVPGDVSNRDHIENIFSTIESTWGAVNVLVNNAAWWEIRPTLEMTPDIWRRMMDVNLTGLFFCGQRGLRRMVEMRSGVIINVTSIAGKTGGKNPVPHYAAAKAGVIALTKSWATEFAPFGIRVNAVAPGVIDTPMAGPIVKEFSSVVPLRRVGRPEEVAEAVLFLARQIDGYITGEILDVNGGLFMD